MPAQPMVRAWPARSTRPSLNCARRKIFSAEEDGVIVEVLEDGRELPVVRGREAPGSVLTDVARALSPRRRDPLGPTGPGFVSPGQVSVAETLLVDAVALDLARRRRRGQSAHFFVGSVLSSRTSSVLIAVESPLSFASSLPSCGALR